MHEKNRMPKEIDVRTRITYVWTYERIPSYEYVLV